MKHDFYSIIEQIFKDMHISTHNMSKPTTSNEFTVEVVDRVDHSVEIKQRIHDALAKMPLDTGKHRDVTVEFVTQDKPRKYTYKINIGMFKKELYLKSFKDYIKEENEVVTKAKNQIEWFDKVKAKYNIQTLTILPKSQLQDFIILSGFGKNIIGPSGIKMTKSQMLDMFKHELNQKQITKLSELEAKTAHQLIHKFQ